MYNEKIARKLHKNKDELLSFCETYKRIHLFGAGYVAGLIYDYLLEEEIKIEDVIVSDGHKKFEYFRKLQVYEMSKIKLDRNDGIILGISKELQNQVRSYLIDIGVTAFQIYCQEMYLQYSTPFIHEEMKLNDSNRKYRSGYFSQYKDLDDIGKNFGTDKSSLYHDYLKKYEFFFLKWKEEKITVLELGVFQGSSIKTWDNYFKNATIYGVDFNEDCKQYNNDNCKIIIKDISCEDELRKLKELNPTIIIDDASHLWSHQIKALYWLLPSLQSGGIFIIEDLETSFSSYRDMNYNDAVVSTYDFCSAVAEIVTSEERLQMKNKDLNLYFLKKEIENLALQIEMISFIHGSCIIVKK